MCTLGRDLVQFYSFIVCIAHYHTERSVASNNCHRLFALIMLSTWIQYSLWMREAISRWLPTWNTQGYRRASSLTSDTETLTAPIRNFCWWDLMWRGRAVSLGVRQYCSWRIPPYPFDISVTNGGLEEVAINLYLPHRDFPRLITQNVNTEPHDNPPLHSILASRPHSISKLWEWAHIQVHPPPLFIIMYIPII